MSGNVFKTKVSPINRDAARPIVNHLVYILNKLDKKPSRIAPIGSYYRKEILGDIDLLVKTDYSIDELEKKLLASPHTSLKETKIIRGLNILSILIRMEFSNKNIQVDLFVHPTSLSDETLDIFYGHVEEEEYTNKHRIFLLFAITESNIRKNPNGESYFRNSLRPDGIYNIEKLNKNNKTIATEFVTNNIHDISELLFRKRQRSYKKWNTFKKIWNLAKAQGYDMKEVADNFKKHNLEMPKEILELNDIKC